MGCDVYANGMSIACKAADGKTAAAFPDTCFTPPLTPATPPGVPIPYPNTAMASDTTDGSKTVMISGQEVMLKNVSVFKTSTGDEAGNAPKKGVVTSQIKGKVNFCAWSMDVKFEGENVPRHLDLTGHNEASDPPNTPPWPYMDSMAKGAGDPCEEDKAKEEDACGSQSRSQQCADTGCQNAQKCKLVPYGGSGSPNCCPGQTGHHMIEDHWVQGVAQFEMAHGSSGRNAAPTVCCEGTRFTQDHGEMHATQGLIEEAHMPGGSMASTPWNYGQGKFAATTAHDMTFPASGCSKQCMEAQLDTFYGGDNSRPLSPPSTQSIAVNDTANDGRWLRDAATESLSVLRSGA
jgi:hypothetical protein